MKITAFYGHKNYRVGAFVAEDEIVDLTHLVSNNDLNAEEFLYCFNLEGDFLSKAEAEIAENLPRFRRSDLRLASPVPRPPKIICIGLNYRNHAIESGMEIPKSPIIFSKFASCAIGSGEDICLPKGSEKVDFEAELAVIIGRRAKHISAAEAMNYVFGYANFNDISARDFQFADGQWQRGKSCDTFAPMGEFIATADEIPNPHDLQIQFRLNNEILQNSNTQELIFKIPELLEFLSNSITLEPGDVIATGTPPGVGFARKPPVFLKDDDLCEVEIEGLGILRNTVKAL